MRLCDKMKHAENRIMKKKITLPFEEQLVMRRYHSMAFPTGIIQGDAKEDITPWPLGIHSRGMKNVLQRVEALISLAKRRTIMIKQRGAR